MSQQQNLDELWLPEPDGPSPRLKCELDLDKFCTTLVKPRASDEQYYLPTNCPQAAAAVTSITLHKYDAWLPSYRHEFVVVHFECPPNNRPLSNPPWQYVLHVNRSWDSNTGGWRDWVPIPPWKGSKAAYDQVSIFLASGGQEEGEAKAGTHIIAKVSFKPQSMYLFHFACYLQDRSRNAREYPFVGVNCWSWSRILIGTMVTQKSDAVVQADIADSKGVLKAVSPEELMRFLLGSVWAMLGSFPRDRTFLSLFRVPGEGNDGATHLGVHLLVFLLKIAILLLGSFKYPNMWNRHDYVHVTKENTIWYPSGQDVTRAGKPHIFIKPDSLAWLCLNTAASPYSNSLCSPGSFLYLLTPPLPPTTSKFRFLETVIESREMRKSDIFRATEQTDVVPEAPKGPSTRFAWGIVRVQEENGTRTLVQLTPSLHHVGWNAVWSDTTVPTPSHSMKYCLGPDHPLLQALRPGDMVGLWAISDHEEIVNVVWKARISVMAAWYWSMAPSSFSSGHATFWHPEMSTNFNTL